jgi:hypothetical protein
MRCNRCGQDNQPGSSICQHCGAALQTQFSDESNPFGESNPYLASVVEPPQQPTEDSATVRMLIPVGRSIHAIIAGYLGLLSPAFCFLGPFAILFGILAIRDIRRDSTKHGMVRAILGIVLGSVGTVLFGLALVGFASRQFR